MKKRDFSLIGITALVMCIPMAIIAHKNADEPVIKTTAIEWKDIKVIKTAIGESRKVFNGPTETLEKLDVHITTLNPGDSSHAPHHHPEEEMLIIKEGNVKALVDGEWKAVGPGSIVFEGSNHVHALKNNGNTPCTYYAIQWRSTKTGVAAK